MIQHIEKVSETGADGTLMNAIVGKSELKKRLGLVAEKLNKVKAASRDSRNTEDSKRNSKLKIRDRIKLNSFELKRFPDIDKIAENIQKGMIITLYYVFS